MSEPVVYSIHALDPDGKTFLKTTWQTPHLPRIGEEVKLPDVRGIWQEMTVEEVQHYPDDTRVWLGGTDGWDPGSVAQMFALAADYYADE